jgi:hypothetical protein
LLSDARAAALAHTGCIRMFAAVPALTARYVEDQVRGLKEIGCNAND